MIISGWLAWLLVFSTLLYQRNNLTADFATYNQAWTLIGQGHLNPFSTIYASSSFLKRDLELILWPMAAIHLVFPNPIVLLWIQDLAVAASAFVVYLWITDYLARQRIAWRWSIGIAVLVLTALIVNPGVYQTLLYDFHLEPISTVFVLLAGRDIWLGRHRRFWVWIAIALTCGSFAAITLLGLGLSAILAGHSTRRAGLWVIAASLAWLAFISLLGANSGAGLNFYAYLAGRTTLSGPTSVLLIIGGVLGHPGRVITTLYDRLHYFWVLIRPVGVIGFASAWGFGVPFVVLVTNALNSQYGFIFQAFQNSAVFPFVLLGTVMVLIWVVKRFRFGWIPAALVTVAIVVQALTYASTTSLGNVRWATGRVAAPQAAQLTHALGIIPPQAEVISTIGIMGRFSGRQWSYWYEPKGTYPIKSRPVFFVFDPANENTISQVDAADDVAASKFVQSHLGASVRIDADGVTVLEWQPSPGTRSVVLHVRS